MAAEPPSALHAIEQPAQPVAETLRSIARQTGASVLFDPGAVNGRMSRAVSGRMSAAEAISRALGGSGLAVDVMKAGGTRRGRCACSCCAEIGIGERRLDRRR
jgi:iron complex outermembrane receptor protein